MSVSLSRRTWVPFGFSLGLLFLPSSGRARALEIPTVAGSAVEISPQLGHTSDAAAVAFSPDGKSLLSGSHDMTMRLWDVATGKEIWKFDPETRINAVAFAPDGSGVAAAGSTAGKGPCVLIDAATGKERMLFKESGVASAVAFSPDGKSVALGCRDGNVPLFEVLTRKKSRTLTGETCPIPDLALSRDGRTLVVAGYRGQ